MMQLFRFLFSSKQSLLAVWILVLESLPQKRHRHPRFTSNKFYQYFNLNFCELSRQKIPVLWIFNWPPLDFHFVAPALWDCKHTGDVVSHVVSTHGTRSWCAAAFVGSVPSPKETDGTCCRTFLGGNSGGNPTLHSVQLDFDSRLV